MDRKAGYMRNDVLFINTINSNNAFIFAHTGGSAYIYGRQGRES